MKSTLQLAADLVDECLKDSKVLSAERMYLIRKIEELANDRYKAGMMRAADIAHDEGVNYEDTQHPEDAVYNTAVSRCVAAIRAEAEKEEG